MNLRLISRKFNGLDYSCIDIYDMDDNYLGCVYGNLVMKGNMAVIKERHDTIMTSAYLHNVVKVDYE